METAIGVFKSRERAEEAFKELLDNKVPQESIAFLTQSETEAVSVAKEVGTYAGGFLGGAAGMTAGIVATTIFFDSWFWSGVRDWIGSHGFARACGSTRRLGGRQSCLG